MSFVDRYFNLFSIQGTLPFNMNTMQFCFFQLVVGVCLLGVACKKPFRNQTSASVMGVSSIVTASVAPDENSREIHYAKIRTALRVRSTEYLETIRLLSVGNRETSRLRAFFKPTQEGEKEAIKIAKEVTFTGKEGMSMKRYEINDISFDETLTKAVVTVFEEQNQRGRSRCVLYKLHWAELDSLFYRTALTDLHVIQCD